MTASNGKQDSDFAGEDYRLVDLVELSELQRIQDAFAEACQVASTITDREGKPITEPSNHSKVCTMIRASEKGLENCIISGEHLGLEAARRMKPFHKMCLSCGFTDAAAPILVGGRHIGNWLVGQYHVGDVDERRIREYAGEIGVDKEAMVEAFYEMPKLSLERFERTLSFLWILANQISEMGYRNLLRKRQTERLEHLSGQLERHRSRLEKTVEERTAELVALNRDLKEEIDHRKRIQQEQEQLIAAIEHAAEAIVITDTSPQITYVNPAFERITGYSAEEAVGKNPSILKSNCHNRQFYAELWETIGRGETWMGRFKNRKKDGTHYEEESTISSVKDNRGNVVNYVAIKRDITRETELERQLWQSKKLESIGTLAAGIAHEINTPVQYVLSNINFLGESIADLFSMEKVQQQLVKRAEEEGRYEETIEEIKRLEKQIDLVFLREETGDAVDGAREGLQKIAETVNALKDFSLTGSAEKEAQDINRLISNTAVVMASQWRGKTDLILELDKSNPEVPLVSEEFKQVVLNLISNGVDAVEKRFGSDAKHQGKIKIASFLVDDCVRIVVSDNGCGIPEEHIDRIFDPFFTTKEVGQGMGQGLAMVHNVIVEKHDGTLNVSSTVDVGSEFILTLPLRQV